MGICLRFVRTGNGEARREGFLLDFTDADLMTKLGSDAIAIRLLGQKLFAESGSESFLRVRSDPATTNKIFLWGSLLDSRESIFSLKRDVLRLLY
jgi:hypothetical protein